MAQCEGLCQGIQWVYSEWSPCTKTCGGGEQSRQARCQDQGTGKVLEDGKCRNVSESLTRVCSHTDCPGWVAGDWSECSASCGVGVRQRPVWCEQGGSRVTSEVCDSEAVPVTREECSAGTCGRWRPGQWAPCSAQCGPGVTTREVLCVDQHTRNNLPEEKCLAHKKPSNHSSCIEISCEDSDNEEDNVIDTDAVTNKEVTKKSIKTYSSEKDKSIIANRKIPIPRTPNVPRYRWKIGHWTKCSVSCGQGLQKRVVACYDRVRGKMEEEQSKCSRVRPKPKDKQACNSRNCPVGMWLEGEWSACSVSCGKVNPCIKKSYETLIFFRE